MLQNQTIKKLLRVQGSNYSPSAEIHEPTLKEQQGT